MSVAFEQADALCAPAAELIAAAENEMRALYEGSSTGGVRSLTSTDLTPPDGRYLLGRVEGNVVCGGGLRRLDDEAAEIKRMYTVPDFRRRGYAADLLGALEEEVLSMGLRIVRLDTGPRQQHAQRLYERSGYVAIGNYNANPYASFWGEKVLSG